MTCDIHQKPGQGVGRDPVALPPAVIKGDAGPRATWRRDPNGSQATDLPQKKDFYMFTKKIQKLGLETRHLFSRVFN